MALSSLRRGLPLILGVGLGIVVGRVGYRAAQVTRLMIAGLRRPPWRHPAELGLAAEEVTFTADDDVTLRGWLIPTSSAGGPAPAVVFVHGWPWCRSGNRAGDTLIPDRTVDFLEPARTLHQAGFHVLLFDLRNHGLSDAAYPVTFGFYEARDFAAAIAMLRRRADVDGDRIGAIGFSMGANTLLYGIPRCQPIRAAIAVQPTSGMVFAPNAARTLFGSIGPALLAMLGPLHRAFGAPPLAEITPADGAAQLGETRLLYIQGSGDPWGSLPDVQAMVARTPNASPLIVAPSVDRYGGYLYVHEHLDEIVDFFTQHLSGD
jgi:uncharacterized protein